MHVKPKDRPPILHWKIWRKLPTVYMNITSQKRWTDTVTEWGVSLQGKRLCYRIGRQCARQTLGYVTEQGVTVISLTTRDNKPLEFLAAKCCLHNLATLIFWNCCHFRHVLQTLRSKALHCMPTNICTVTGFSQIETGWDDCKETCVEDTNWDSQWNMVWWSSGICIWKVGGMSCFY